MMQSSIEKFTNNPSSAIVPTFFEIEYLSKNENNFKFLAEVKCSALSPKVVEANAGLESLEHLWEQFLDLRSRRFDGHRRPVYVLA
jgi:hypothetical protein